MPVENTQEAHTQSSRQRDDALQLGPRKKMYVSFTTFAMPAILLCFTSCVSDPLVGYGRHFGRTVHALCNVQSLLTNGILRLGEQADEPEEAFTAE
jgi:hypothetical protein